MALLSITVRIALLLLSTMRSISQTPKRLPSVSAGRSCMLTRFFILVALVSLTFECLQWYVILWRQLPTSPDIFPGDHCSSVMSCLTRHRNASEIRLERLTAMSSALSHTYFPVSVLLREISRLTVDGEYILWTVDT